LKVNLVLDSPHPSEVKEQALCILGNIGAGARDKDYILEDEHILNKLLEFLVSIRFNKVLKVIVVKLISQFDDNNKIYFITI
jgi:hypothetical protein